MCSIQKVVAREVLDSRGNPTVEAEVILQDGTKERAIAPSGASTGEFEAWELRDWESKRYLGKGVLKVVEGIQREVNPLLIGRCILEQRALDNAMLQKDGTKEKSRLGANGILSVSLACAKAGAKICRYIVILVVSIRERCQFQ